MKRSLSAIALIALSLSAAHAQDTTAPTPVEMPPPPAAPRPVTVPKPVEARLPNGLRILCISRPGSGIVSARLIISSAGAFLNDAKTAGEANLVADMLTQGTTTKSATQIAESIERLGASLNAGAGYDSTAISLNALKTSLPNAFSIFADVVLHPSFPQEEIQRLKTQNVDDLSVSLRQPGTLVRYVSSRTLYGTFSYGNPLTGTPQTVKALQRNQLIAFHAITYQPQTSVLVFAGDITPGQALAMAREQFGKWKQTPYHVTATASTATLKSTSSTPPQAKRKIIVIDYPEAGQAAVVVNRLGIDRADPSYVLATVTNDILGGGYSSRLNHEVRIKRGLSYGAGSRLDARRFVGPLSASAQTKNESAGETARVIVDELAKMGTEDVSSAELAARKSALAGDFARSLETSSGLASLVGNLALYKRPLSELNTYLPKVQATTAAQVKAFAAKRFSADEANVLIVGNAAKFLPDLKTRFPDETIRVVPFADLDLNSPTLSKGGK